MYVYTRTAVFQSDIFTTEFPTGTCYKLVKYLKCRKIGTPGTLQLFLENVFLDVYRINPKETPLEKLELMSRFSSFTDQNKNVHDMYMMKSI